MAICCDTSWNKTHHGNSFGPLPVKFTGTDWRIASARRRLTQSSGIARGTAGIRAMFFLSQERRVVQQTFEDDRSHTEPRNTQCKETQWRSLWIPESWQTNLLWKKTSPTWNTWHFGMVSITNPTISCWHRIKNPSPPSLQIQSSP